MSENKKIKIAFSHGDINGIGYEVMLKALEDPQLLDLITPVIYGSGRVAGFYRKALDLSPLQLVTRNTGDDFEENTYNLVNVVDEDLKIDPGMETEAAGQASLASLETAMTDLKNGKVDAIVTAPINKHNIQSSTFHFPGHTEYLQAIAGNEYKALMILACEHLRVALVTTHIPLAKVAESLTVDSIYDKIEQFDTALRRDFGIVRPRIAVLGLNPHAGDEGVIGNEEKEIIIPAIQKACEKRIEAYGPYAADGFFGSGAFKHFDGVLAMYHDQGLIPFKTLAMGQGVNITSGLPFVRTSPDHGTAYDIAGKGVADPQSMKQAIYAACDIIRNRQRYDEMTANPLRKQYFDRSKDNVVLDLTSD